MDFTHFSDAPEESKPINSEPHSVDIERASDDSQIQAIPEKPHKYDIGKVAKRLWRRYKMLWVFVIWLLLSAYFIASMALKHKTQLSDVLPFIFLYAFISLKMLFSFVSTRYIAAPVGVAGNWTAKKAMRAPKAVQYAAGVMVLLAIVLSVSLSMPESSNGRRIDRMQSFLGICVIIILLAVTSKHMRHIQWHTVIVGVLAQFILGCVVVKTKWGNDLFTWIANMASSFLGFSRYGAKFVFGDEAGSATTFVMSLVPALIFFASFVQMVNYLGGIQWLLRHIGGAIQKLLDTSGAESLVAAAAPFIGSIEGALMLKDYLPHMTKSELHACMTTGFATVSGSMFQAYIALGVDPRNIITACIMSIPCSLALSKIRYPETEESLTRGKKVEPSRTADEANVIHALGNGAAIGVNLSLLILANLISVISLLNLVDFLLTWLGQFVGIHQLTLELVLGYILYPYAWLLGVPSSDAYKVAQLLDLKVISNEVVAYQRLGDSTSGPSIRSQLSSRGSTIIEFALCGFGNLGTIAIYIGAMGALAPSRKGELSRLALSACITGSIATAMTAAIISMII